MLSINALFSFYIRHRSLVDRACKESDARLEQLRFSIKIFSHQTASSHVLQLAGALMPSRSSRGSAGPVISDPGLLYLEFISTGSHALHTPTHV